MKSVSLSRRLYQRSLPIYITAFIIGFSIVYYFVNWAPLNTLYGQSLIWSNIVSVWVWAFANVVLVLNATRRILRGRQEDSRAWWESTIMLATVVLILGIAFSDPANLDRGTVYTTVYKGLIGAIYLGIESTGITYQVYNIMRRLGTSRITLESGIIIVVYLLMGFRTIALITYNIPITFTIAEWIEKVAYSTTTRAITIVGAIGTLVLAVRALVGKEPGIIEMEMG